MLVDSSALPEQVVADVAALGLPLGRPALLGAARPLRAGRRSRRGCSRCWPARCWSCRSAIPGLLATDVGPVIDEAARERLEPPCRAHAARGAADPARAARSGAARRGCFFAPHAFEIDRIEQLEGEVFGPILHVVRFAGDRLDQVVDAINGTGYGLTLGVHSRIDQTIERVLRAGARRQHLRQPQHDRRRGRRAAVRRRAPLGHRPQGRRPALSAALRDRAHGQRQHRRGRRQRQPAQPRRRRPAAGGRRPASRSGAAEAERVRPGRRRAARPRARRRPAPRRRS